METITTYIYTLSLHDALPISHLAARRPDDVDAHAARTRRADPPRRFHRLRHDAGVAEVRADRADLRLARPHRVHDFPADRSEEHTSELQSQSNLVCRLLLEKK